MEINELRIGNVISYYQNNEKIYDKIKSIYFNDETKTYHVEMFSGRYNNAHLTIAALSPIRLTKDILLQCNFFQLPHFTVSDSLMIKIKDNKLLSINNVRTPNEMLFLRCCLSLTEPDDIICLHNYDYDGRLTLHKLQNIYFDLTHNELDVKHLLTPND